jgi:hypothetical protein
LATTVAPPRLNRPVDFDDYPQAIADYLTAHPDEAQGLACLYKLYEAWGMPYFSGERSCRAGNTDTDPDDEVAVVLVDRLADDVALVTYRLAVIDPAHGGYEVAYASPLWELIVSDYAISRLGNVILAMEDLNADGVGELAYGAQWCGAHTCGINVKIVSGATHGYVALTPTSIDPYSDGYRMATPVRVEFTDEDGDGVKELVLRGGEFGSVGAGPQRERTETYAWDGSMYVLRSRVVDTPSLRYHAVIDADQVFREGDYGKAEEMYRLAATSTDPEPTWSPSGFKQEPSELAAYALFRAALSALLAGRDGDVVSSHLAGARSFDGTLHPRLAAAFEDAYRAKRDVSEACTAVNDLVDANLLAYQEFWYYGYANPTFDPAAMCPF